METEIDPGEGVKKDLMIFNGKEGFASGKKLEEGALKSLPKDVRVSLARCGMTAPMNFLFGKKVSGDMATRLKASDWKLGKPTEIDGKQATVVTHQVMLDDDKTVFETTVFVDAATSLPLKRVLTYTSPGGVRAVITESYTDWAIDQPIPEEQFKIPAQAKVPGT